MIRYLKLVLLAISILFSQATFAQTISESQAMANAQKVLSLNKPTSNSGGPRRAAATPTSQELTLAYTARKGAETYYYVFNIGNDNGFIIAGGDAVAHEILAYIPQGHFIYDSIPDNVKWWLGEYEKEISSAKKLAPQSQKRNAAAPKRATQSSTTTDVRDLFTDIPDLITTKWNQTEPYNAAIPEIQHTNGSSIVSPTGCVPTAIAQIMNYWQWPTTGVGSYSYTLDYDGLDEWSAGVAEGSFDGLLPATFSADFGSTTYDWANMLDDYSIGNPTQAQIDAVSTLMYHVGVSEQTLYGPGGSGGGIDRMMKALKENFRYSHRISYLLRGDYLDDEWEEIIYSEIQAGRPVYYEGGMHAFLLHGYSADYKMFSVNWGWGGFMDGYWKITGTTSGYFFNDENFVEDWVGHGICINLEPNNIVHSNTFSNVGDTIVVDGIRYDLIGPLSKTVEVTFAPNDEVIYEGELTIPDSITFNNDVYAVTKIGRYGLASAGADYYGILMSGTSAVTSVHLPNTLRSIACGGLSGSNIRELQLPESVEMLAKDCFSRMTELTSVTLSNQLTYIPHYCFWQCHKLESVNLPASINALGAMSFVDCTSLELLVSNAINVPITAIDAEHGIPAIFSSNLEGKVLAVPQVSIDDYRTDPTFGQWGTIIPLDSLPEHFGERFVVDDIEYKFLASSEVSAIGYKGNAIDPLIIPSTVSYEGNTYSVFKISPGDFANKEIRSIIIEDGIREIGAYAFSKNNSINYVSLPGTIEVIGNSAFGGCQGLKTIDIANGLKEIGETAFANCWQLISVVMPNTVEKIGGDEFISCSNLEDVKLSSTLTELPNSVFEGTRIKSLVLPQGIIKISSLGNCDSLHTMICYAPNVPLVEYPFPSNISQGTLYVPAESVSAYQSAPYWQDWGTILPLVTLDSLRLESISIEKLFSDTLIVHISPSNVTEGQIFYSSSNPRVAKIDADGIITAIEVGETTITAETMDGKSATCTVTVTPTDYIAVGGANGVHWTLSQDSVLMVYGTGIFEPYSTGFESYRNYVKEAYISTGITLGWGALGWYYNLVKVELPNEMSSISAYAFYADQNLKEITLPSGITSIGEMAFESCYRLTSIISNAIIPPTLGANAFYGRADIPVFVPCGSQDAYRNDSGWNYFTNIIETKYKMITSSGGNGYATSLLTPNCENDTAVIEAQGYYGYIFDHWSDGNTDNPRTIVLDQDTSLTAYFTEGYNIYFYNSDGSFLQTVGTKRGEMPVYSGPTPTQEGGECHYYVFTGWSPELAPVTENAYYYAQFDIRYYKYNVVFQDYDGAILQQDSVGCGNWGYYSGQAPTRPSTDQYNYSFVGWSPNPNNMWVNEDKVYVAQYDSIARPYLITFTDEFGNILQQEWVEYGQMPTYDNGAPYKPADAQYTYSFSGWSPAIDVVTGEATYTAIFSHTTNSYMVSFVNYDGTTLQSGNVNYGVTPSYAGATPTKPATAQYTYTFAGWDKEIVTVVGAETYTAQFDSVVNKYTITFVDEDGTTLQTSEVEYGQVPAYNGTTPSKQSTAQYTYAFAGWSPEVVSVTGAATYTATYSSTVNSYLITFVNYDGTILQSGNVNYGATPAYTGATPTKPATVQYTYTFKGWDKEIVSVVGVETYTAQFDSVVNKYTIAFVDEDGTTLQTSEVEYGQVPAYNGATPTKLATGEFTYTFAGWSPEVVAVTGAATYTATYSSTINSYLITFVNYDGSTLQSGSVNYGVTPTYIGATPTKPATAQYTYTFKGWDKEIVPVVGAESYMAQFDSVVNKYTITFVDEDGTMLQTSEVEYGQVPAYNSATPTKPATGQYTYTFAGWSPEVVAVTATATYTATYSSTINSYLINGEYHDYGEEVTLTADVPNCERFVSWSDGNTDNPRTITVTGDITLTPIFAINRYQITWKDENGVILAQDSVDCGSMPAYNGAAPEKTATPEYTYTFAGWSPTIEIAHADAEYTAVFSSTSNVYSVTFVNYDGTVLQSGDVAYGTTPSYNGATPLKPGTAQYTYSFAGWDTEIVSVTGKATYTAMFNSVVNKYQITFVDEQGVIFQQDSVEYGQMPAYLGSTPEKPATAQYTYTFTGWTPAVEIVTANAIYTAVFSSTVNQYAVTFLGFDDELLKVDSVKYGQAAVAPEAPIVEGYQFFGWDADFSVVTCDITVHALYIEQGNALEDLPTEHSVRKFFRDGYFYIQTAEGLFTMDGRRVE